jgi:hypothetical protein
MLPAPTKGAPSCPLILPRHRIRGQSPPRPISAQSVALAGIGLVGYGLMFLIRNFTGFIELGLTPEHIGGTPEQIQAFSPRLFYPAPLAAPTALP